MHVYQFEIARLAASDNL